MINLPIAELLTPTGGAATANAPDGQTDMPDGIGFLQVMAEMPLPNRVGGPQSGVDDTEQEFVAVSSTQMLGKQKTVPETGAFLPQIMGVVPQVEFDIPEGSQDSLPAPVSDPETDIGDLSATVLVPDNMPNLKTPIATVARGHQEETRADPVVAPLVDPLEIDKVGAADSFMPANTIPVQNMIAGANEALQKTVAAPAQKEMSNFTGKEKTHRELSKAGVTVPTGKALPITPFPTIESQAVPADARPFAHASKNPVPAPYSTDETAQPVFGKPKLQETDTAPIIKQNFIRQNAVPSMGNLLDTTESEPVEKQMNVMLHDKSATALQDVRISGGLPKQRLQPVALGLSKPAPATPVQSEIAPPLRIPADASLPDRNAVNTAPAPTASATTPGTVVATPASVFSGKPAGDTQALPRHKEPHVPLPATPVTAANPAAQPTMAMPIGIQNPTALVDAALDSDGSESLERFDLPPTGPHHTDPASLRTDPLTARPEISRHVARQLADVARQMPDRPVELTLNPEELGRVRLTFTLTDGGINVAVLTERGETMDLLRRHIETLAQEFRDMGYSDVGFQFSQNSQGSSDGGGGGGTTEHRQTLNMPLPESENTPPAKLSLEPSTGLDLRL